MRKRFTPRVDGHHAAVRNPLGRSRPHMLRRDASHRLRSPGLPASSGPHHQDRVKCSQSCPDILHASEHGMSTLKSHTGPGQTGHRSTQAFHVTPPAPGYERCRGDTGRRKVTPDAMLYSTSLQHMEQNSAAVGTARYTAARRPLHKNAVHNHAAATTSQLCHRHPTRSREIPATRVRYHA